MTRELHFLQAPAPEEDGNQAGENGEPADKDEQIAPEAHREQADEVVIEVKQPGIAGEKELVKFGEEQVKV